MKIKIPLLICGLIGAIFYACSFNKISNIDKTVEAYYQIFNERQNIEKFLDFYDEQIVLEDIINGDKIVGKQALKKFFDWSNPNFKNLNSNNLIISEKIIHKNKSVVKGYFTKFKWGQSEFEAMHFTTILTFNTSGKIIKQVDWINYPASLVNYNERKNSNKWIE